MTDRIFNRRCKWVIVEVQKWGAWRKPLGTMKPKRVRGGYKVGGQSYIGSNIYLIRNSNQEYHELMVKVLRIGGREYAKPSRMKRIRRCVTSSRFTRPLLKAAVGAALLVWLMHLMEIILRIYHTAGEPPV